MLNKYFIIFLISIFLFTGLSGCKISDQREPADEDNQTEQKSYDEDINEVSGDKVKVYMMGRSVMTGWFEYWGYDWTNPVIKKDYVLYFKELETPPEIIDSAQSIVNEIEEKEALVFFKFCFDDFWAGSKDEARESLSEKKEYILEVYELTCRENDYKLIIGNALPKVKIYTDKNLVWLEKEYNQWLEKFANKHKEDVYIFDQYSVLTDKKGNLKNSYALSEEDSHLNEKAYKALDINFFKLLDQISISQ